MSSALWKAQQRGGRPQAPTRVSVLRSMRQFEKLAELAERKKARRSRVKPDGFLIADEEANARTWMRELRAAGYSVEEVKREIAASNSMKYE